MQSVYAQNLTRKWLWSIKLNTGIRFCLHFHNFRYELYLLLYYLLFTSVTKISYALGCLNVWVTHHRILVDSTTMTWSTPQRKWKYVINFDWTYGFMVCFFFTILLISKRKNRNKNLKYNRTYRIKILWKISRNSCLY